MNSSNISYHSLNRRGALELGESLCEYCCSGYTNYTNGICTSCYTSCYTSCEYLRIFNNKEEMEQIKVNG